MLLRVTRNCPWNKCAFCAVYKKTKFSRRSVEEIVAEIDLLAAAANRVRERAAAAGEIGRISPRVVMEIAGDPCATEEERRMALWLHNGGAHVFIQDADSLAIPTHKIAAILRHLCERFPSIDRITTYARSRTLVARSLEQLSDLRQAGLTRIHVGVESGCDEVLSLIDKGCTAEHHLIGCKKAKEAGFDVCCYVMPGLGGKRLSDCHARETAKVLKEIDPPYVRLRTLWIDPGSPLDKIYLDGEFEPLEEDETVVEIRTMLQGLKGATGRVVSDHDRNLLTDIEGHLTDDAEALDTACRRFLDLSEETRNAFVVARRTGYYSSLERFLSDPGAADKFAKMAQEIVRVGGGSLIKGMAVALGRRSI